MDVRILTFKMLANRRQGYGARAIYVPICKYGRGQHQWKRKWNKDGTIDTCQLCGVVVGYSYPKKD